MKNPDRNTNISLLRIKYLIKISEIRDEGRPIIYTGETYHVAQKDATFKLEDAKAILNKKLLCCMLLKRNGQSVN